jgi:large subunit ribosomal protein L4
VVFTQGAYEAFVGGTTEPMNQPVAVATLADVTTEAAAAPAAPTDVKTEKSEKPAKTEKVEKAEDAEKAGNSSGLPKGAKAPLKSGGAPKGYEVKGNADSGLFHEPDGQWYDQTVAEFYFKTAEDAEAAGLTRAGDGPAAEEGEK